ncbi:MAG TPA: type II toxin-antitoxin system VapC family toxin [Candidatus Sulfotelmatobacter sp.]|jgi:PIN domain nuclease of toxin-antitoxin system
MSSVVLDASAVMAVLNRELGAAKLPPSLLSKSVCSTVNLAEVQSKLVERGIQPDDAWAAALSPINESLAFSPEQAKTAGSLIAQTRPLGLSLGDRACLALALSLNAPVYTADRSWKNLKVGVRIHVIR